MSRVLVEQNMTHVLGDCYADDWAIPDPERVAEVYLRQVDAGSVAIMHMPEHGFREHTYETMRLFLEGLSSRGFSAVTLSHLDALARGNQNM